MKFFRTRFKFPLDDAVEVEHASRIPVTICPTCGAKHAEVGLSCSILLTEITDGWTRKIIHDKKRFEVSWDEYKRLIQQITPALPKDAIVAPGVGLGVQKAKFYRNPPDCYMPDESEFLISRRFLQELTLKGIQLLGNSVSISQSKWKHLDFVDIWAAPLGCSNEPQTTLYCEECHRSRGRAATTLIAASIPSNNHCFKLRDCPRFFVVSDVFAQELSKIKGLNCEFEELKVVLS